ncbi:MAG: hypothetical protein KME35_21330 [Aphanocapsa sp. GSE-SYN-MK-11-07L]|nr:hypothetical protein [Aphanocapsa sp. GSE-SYN-MK-11-07L]
MSDPVIRVSNLGKKDVIGHQQQGRSPVRQLSKCSSYNCRYFTDRILRVGDEL